MLEVSECPGSGPLFDAVLRLSKQAKATVGFMPDDAFRDRAARGTLLVAAHRDDIRGYVLYDLPRNEVRIRQLVTAADARRQGIARHLVDELAGQHSSRRGIVLECRRDFPVSAAWPRLGFVPVEERAGRSQARLPLTIWFRSFGHPTLFSVVRDDADRPIAAVDTNIVIDLADSTSATTERLHAEWAQNTVQFAITDQVLIEIDRQDDATTRTQHRRRATRLSQLTVQESRWKHLHNELQERISNSAKFDDDLRHAAMAAAGGARWLVTHDGEFKRACAAPVKAVTDVEIVSPGELLLALDAIVRDDTYRPTDLYGSSLELRTVTSAEFEAIARAFVNHREGERLTRFRAELERIAAGTRLPRLQVMVDGEEYLAVLGYAGDAALEVPICRVRRGAAQATIARQVVAIARQDGVTAGATTVRLVDAHCGELVRNAATAEGYLPAGAGFTAVPVDGMGTRTELLSRLEAVFDRAIRDVGTDDFLRVAQTDGADAATEELFHPWRLTGVDLPTFVVPIKPSWAGELFDVDIARGSLFPRQQGLALNREHVYYRHPSAGGGLRAPGRLIWYVEAGPTHVRGLRAISSLRDVVVGDPRRLYRRFAHLGVYNEQQVRAASDGQKVMALRFSHTSMLPRTVPLDEYRAVMSSRGTGLVLQGPQRLPERVFDELVRLAA